MSHTFSRRALLGASLAAVGGTVLAGCSTPAPTGTASGAAQAPTKLTLSLIPILDVAPAYVAQAKGYFKEFGLEVETVLAQGGAAIVPAVVGGSAHIGFSNIPSLIIGSTKNLPLQVVAPAVSSTGVDLEDANTVVAKDPSIRSAKDLAGKRVSTNALRSIGDSVVMAAVKADGGDPNSITWVELPFPNVEQAVESGQVDAGWLSEPFVTAAVEHGQRVVSTPLTEFTDHTMHVSNYFSSRQYAAANPQAVKAFHDAMVESLAFCRENPDEVRKILPQFMKITPEMAAKVTLPAWPEAVDRTSFEEYERIGREFGFIEGQVDLDTLLGKA